MGVRKLLEGERVGEGIGGGGPKAWKVWERVGGLRGGEGESRIFCSWRCDEGGGFDGDFDLSGFARDGGRKLDGRGGGILLLRLDVRCG